MFRDLGYKTPLTFRPNNYAGIGNDWNFQHNAPSGQQFAADTSDDLAHGDAREPAIEDAVNAAAIVRSRDALFRRRRI